MPDQLQAKRPHFILRDTSQAVEFKAHSAGGGSTRSVPTLPRQQHGASLRDQVENLKPAAAEAVQGQRDLQLESGLGLQIQFSSQPDVELAFESLANETRNIELLSVRREGNQTFANVFVPDGKLAHFEKYISDYLEEKKDSRGQARDHRKLLDAIESIRTAEIRALWTDAPELLPDDLATAFWWEVWLPVRGAGQRQVVVEDFKKLARLAECVVSDKQVNFPERTVLLMYGSQQQFSRSVMTLNCVAELRYAKETAAMRATQLLHCKTYAVRAKSTRPRVGGGPCRSASARRHSIRQCKRASRCADFLRFTEPLTLRLWARLRRRRRPSSAAMAFGPHTSGLSSESTAIKNLILQIND